MEDDRPALKAPAFCVFVAVFVFDGPKSVALSGGGGGRGGQGAMYFLPKRLRLAFHVVLPRSCRCRIIQIATLVSRIV
jgi:hypothetical protein